MSWGYLCRTLKAAFTLTETYREQVFTFPLWNGVFVRGQESCINTDGIQLFFQTTDQGNRKNPAASCV